MQDAAYSNDTTIGDDVELYRRIPPRHFFFDGKLGRMRPSKAAFDDDEDGSPMSVVLSDVLLSLGRTSESLLLAHEGFALAAITAGLARDATKG